MVFVISTRHRKKNENARRRDASVVWLQIDEYFIDYKKFLIFLVDCI